MTEKRDRLTLQATRERIALLLSRAAHPTLRRWRVQNGLAVLRLQTDIRGADRKFRYRAGDTVLGKRWEGTPNTAPGWYIQGAGFFCILDEPDIEIVELP